MKWKFWEKPPTLDHQDQRAELDDHSWKKEIFQEVVIDGDPKASILHKIISGNYQGHGWDVTFEGEQQRTGVYTFANINLFESRETIRNEMARLESMLQDPDIALSIKLETLDSLRIITSNAITTLDGAIPMSPEVQDQVKDSLQVIYSVLVRTTKNPDTPLIIRGAADPEYIFNNPQKPADRWLERVTPYMIAPEIAIIDSGLHGWQMFHIPSEQRGIIERITSRCIDYHEAQQNPMPELHENASLEEMKIHHEKYTSKKIAPRPYNPGDTPQELLRHKLTKESIRRLFPHISSHSSLKYDELVNTARVFFKKGLHEQISHELGVSLQDIPLTEQMYFLMYVSTMKASESERVKSFIHNYGVKGLRSFLSIAHGGYDMANDILRIGEEFPKEAEEIFDEYTSIALVGIDLNNFLVEEFGGSVELDVETLDRIKEKVLRKGVILLKKYSHSGDLEGLRPLLERYNTELDTYFTVLTRLWGAGNKLTLDDFFSVDSHFVALSEIDTETRQKLSSMYFNDRLKLNMVDDYVKGFNTKIIEGAEGLSCFYLEKDNEIVATVFTEAYKEEPAGLLFSGLTIIDEGKNSPLATTFAEYVVHALFAHEHLYAYVDESNRVARNLYKKLGFAEMNDGYPNDPTVVVVHRAPQDSHDQTKPSLHIANDV